MIRSKRAVPFGLCLLFLVASAIRLALAFQALPETMATHFDAAGQANGHQSRAAFAFTSMALELGLGALFLALPAFIRRLPPALINMPHRDYWLAPERRAASIDRLTGQLDWFGCATLALLAAMFELVLRANLTGQQLDSRATWLLLTLYLGFAVAWSISMVRAFRVPG